MGHDRNQQISSLFQDTQNVTNMHANYSRPSTSSESSSRGKVSAKKCLPSSKPEMTVLVGVLHRATEQFVDAIKDLEKFISKDNETETTGEAFHQIAAQITEAITGLENQIITSNTSQRIIPLNCTFSGQEYEDPFSFIEQISQYFHRTRIYDDGEKIAVFRRQLCDRARTWYDSQKYNKVTYQNLVRDFSRHFIVNLYGENQKADEEVASFIIRKENLFKCLHPEMPPRRVVRIITSQMKPAIRLYLRGHDFTDIEELLDVATNIEGDLRDCNLGTVID